MDFNKLELLEDVQKIMKPILHEITSIDDDLTVSRGEDYIFAVLGYSTTEQNILLIIKNVEDSIVGYRMINNLDNPEHVQKTAIALVLELFKDKSKDIYLPMFQHIIDILKETIINIKRNYN